MPGLRLPGRGLARRAARGLRAALGLERPAHGCMAVRDRMADIRDRVRTPHPLIIDGGAHRGAMTSAFRHLFPGSRVQAFEPNPLLAGELRRAFAAEPGVTVHELALGAEEGGIEFHILRNSLSSSVLAPSRHMAAFHGERAGVERTVTVRQARLDALFDEDIDILKLDLQGYELQALKGCGRLLERTGLILTEVEFMPLYDGQALFGDIDVFLRGRGFELLNLYDLFTHPDGRLTAGDAIYINANRR
ncbi:FkbM family methyltransferase [Desulfocurvus sp.]|uniref:FkbM family methyltransferase n=1 Tax=Desulfocurvus sp. TaxID=2871698 RepID=UPI0025BFF8B6|nr:FkbM family methyltransferase [Desulfocurvus sp.]MCK9238806.1 FkbM family methyltransferase [Desulfocurvus sp.]